MRTTSNNIVIGLGNQYRRDDAAGLIVARRLRGRTSCAVWEHSGETVALMEYWKGADMVIIADAVQSGGAPGTIHRFDATMGRLPGRFFRTSTHAVNLVEAVELARALTQLPRRLIVYGIEGQNFEAGIGLSVDVESAIQEVVERILGEIGATNPSKTVPPPSR
ncbi:MAG TPA: hydrogenase maturation protease [Terriglobia bacterium]|nr:hydrogenase maturation protease [Terriglobia bacterium]